MKKLILILTVAFIDGCCYGQFPIVHYPVNNPNLIVMKDSSSGINLWNRIPMFQDTILANKYPIKDIEGAIILLPNKHIYVRSKGKWIELLPTGSKGSVAEPLPQKPYCCNCKCNQK